MIQFQTNSKEVGEAIREIMRLTPRVAKQVLRTVGMAIRKDIRTSIQGKGPIPVAPQKASTRLYKSIIGVPETQGGEMPNYIFTKAGDSSVSIGVATPRRSYFKKYQTGSTVRRFDRREVLGIFMFYADTSYLPDAPESVWDEYNKMIYGRKTKFGDSSDAKAVYRPPRVPARPIIQPLADSPGLATRIRDTATKRLASMARAAAKKVRR